MIDKNLNLQEKTNRLGLFNLANLKLRGDEVTCCKNSIENSREKLFQLENNVGTRINVYKLAVSKFTKKR